MNWRYLGILLLPLLLFGCIEMGDGWIKIGQSAKYVCSDGTTVTSADQCKTTDEEKPSDEEMEEVTVTEPCESSTILNAITSNLLTKSNQCRQTRVTVLCGECSTCCEASGEAKTEYAQSQDATCYSCANTHFGVARARDYYDRLGVYNGKCVENCPDLVNAYKALLEYAEDNKCEVPSGYAFCDDVTLD